MTANANPNLYDYAATVEGIPVAGTYNFTTFAYAFAATGTPVNPILIYEINASTWGSGVVSSTNTIREFITVRGKDDRLFNLHLVDSVDPSSGAYSVSFNVVEAEHRREDVTVDGLSSTLTAQQQANLAIKEYPASDFYQIVSVSGNQIEGVFLDSSGIYSIGTAPFKATGLSEGPVYLYKDKQNITNVSKQTIYQRWNERPVDATVPLLNADGTISFTNYETLPAVGYYRLELDVTNQGETDPNFKGFETNLTIAGTEVAKILLKDQSVFSTEDPKLFALVGNFGDGASTSSRAVADSILAWRPDGVISLGNGDYSGGSSVAAIDYHTGKFYHSLMKPYTGSYGAGNEVENRFWPSMGNQDWGNFDNVTSGLGANVANYNTYFDALVPGTNNRYYDFVSGDIHFFILSTDINEPDGYAWDSIQGTWLKNRLKASTSRWNVVCGHHAPYCSDTAHATTALRWPFKQWGAHAVISSHPYLYERLELDGVVYIVAGTGGAGTLISSVTTTISGSLAMLQEVLGGVRLRSTKSRLVGEFVDTSNVVRDSWEFNIASGTAVIDFVLDALPGSSWDLSLQWLNHVDTSAQGYNRSLVINGYRVYRYRADVYGWTVAGGIAAMASDWSSSVSYTPTQVVYDGSDFYWCGLAISSTAPSSAFQWVKLALTYTSTVWSNVATYTLGSSATIVTNGGNYYYLILTVTVPGTAPGSDATHWRRLPTILEYPGGWLATYDSTGSIAKWTHESKLYPSTGDVDSRDPVALLLAGSSIDRKEDVVLSSMTGSAVESDPVLPAAPTLGALTLTSASANVGQTLLASVVAITGTDLKYVWVFWDGTYLVTDTPTASKYINAGGTLTVTVLAYDSHGQSTSATSNITINHPPVITAITVSVNDNTLPYDTVLNVTATDPEAGLVSIKWYDGTTLLVTTTSGTDYTNTVAAAKTLTLRVSDPDGGYVDVPVELRGGEGQSPSVSIVATPTLPRIGSGQTLTLVATAHNSDGVGVLQFSWTLWDGSTPSSVQSPVSANDSDGNRTSTVVVDISAETIGTKVVLLTVTNDSTLKSTNTQFEVTIGENRPPVIQSVASNFPGGYVSAGTSVQYVATASDPDNDLLTYTWQFDSPALTLYGNPPLAIQTSEAATQTLSSTTADFTAVLGSAPIKPGSLLLGTTSGDTTDDGGGNIIAGGAILGGTIDYASGSIYLLTSATSQIDISANWQHIITSINGTLTVTDLLGASTSIAIPGVVVTA